MTAPRTPAPIGLFFRGRPGDIRLGEWVAAVETLPAERTHKHEAVIVGYPDDQGVRLNRGRTGAAGGPDSIRQYFYKLTLPADSPWEKNLRLMDWGNSRVSSKLSDTHQCAEEVTRCIAQSHRTAICLGGGHDFAAPTFRAFRLSTPAAPTAPWGLINIDPHLDTREMEGPQVHSGNPFRALLEQGHLKGKNFVEFGSRCNRNTRSSWEFCRKRKVEMITLERLRTQKTPTETLFQRTLSKLARQCSAIGVTIDMDSCCDTEGVSAAPVLGFTAWELCCFAACAGRSPKVKYLEIAEVAPGLDVAHRSSRIAAEVIFAFLDARSRLR